MTEKTPHSELPYERFLSSGAESLTNAELLAIILRTGTKELSATQLGREILGIYDSENTALSVLYDLRLEDLTAVRGIGEVKAVKLLCLAELSRRLSRERAQTRLVFTSPSSIADCFMEELRHKKQETVLLLMLDNKLSLIREEILSVGTVNCTLLSSRDIYMHALRAGAVNIVLLHNHPSGDPTPSRQDIESTGRILKAGELLEIRLIDHLVIGDGDYISMKELGYI